MAIRKVKISELKSSGIVPGLDTIGTNAQNQSVRVSLDDVNTAAGNANKAATEAVRIAQQAGTEAIGTAQKAGNDALGIATNAANKANTAAKLADQAREAIAGEMSSKADLGPDRMVLDAQLPKSLGMNLDYPQEIMVGVNGEPRIDASLTPASVRQNLLFIPSRGDSLSVNHRGEIIPHSIGQTQIQVVPPDNTSIGRTITITVREPKIRVTGDGTPRSTSTTKNRIL